jgi:endonuclease/exonuclease/phosphatase family metal-dependent hydrolase
MRLRLATFNLENLDDGPGLEPALDERLPVLRPQLKRLDADVLCLQEVNGQRAQAGGPRRLMALDRLLEGTPYAGFHRASTTSTGDHGGGEPWVAATQNLVVLSRWPITEAREVREELLAPPAYRLATADPPADGPAPLGFDRPVLLARVDLPDGRGPLHVLNLHLRAPLAAPVPGQRVKGGAWRTAAGWAEGFFVAGVKRAAQALEARLLVDSILDAEPGALVAVAGDFNAETHETPVRLLTAGTADTGDGRLAARSLVPLERSLPRDRRFSVVHAGRPVLLDHLLVSRPLLGSFRRLEIHAETLADDLGPEQAVAQPTESYHAPLVAEFELPDDG